MNDLSQVNTKDLVEELVKRAGVDEIKVEPCQTEQIAVEGSNKSFDSQEILREQMKIVAEASKSTQNHDWLIGLSGAMCDLFRTLNLF